MGSQYSFLRNTILILVLALASPAYADEKQVWDIISYATAGTNISLDVIHAVKTHQVKRHLIKTGIVIGSSELIKLLVHEERPDKSDMKSFWSEHTALASVSTGYNKGFGLSFTVLTGTGRVLADKHHWWDVVAGASVGLVVDHFIN